MRQDERQIRTTTGGDPLQQASGPGRARVVYPYMFTLLARQAASLPLLRSKKTASRKKSVPAKKITDSDSESDPDPDNEEVAPPQAEARGRNRSQEEEEDDPAQLHRKFAAQKTKVAGKKSQNNRQGPLFGDVSDLVSQMGQADKGSAAVGDNDGDDDGDNEDDKVNLVEDV